MTDSQWQYFSDFKNRFRLKCQEWQSNYGAILVPLQISAAKEDGVPSYPVENSIVFNTDLEKITPESDIRLIVIGDNPGKDEQRNCNQKYLCGQSGKIAEGYFRKNPELNIDFRENVIILNKTPVHTAKTKELKTIAKRNPQVAQLIVESQIWMARETLALQSALNCPIWIVGYSEIKSKGIFEVYRTEFVRFYGSSLGAEFASESDFGAQNMTQNMTNSTTQNMTKAGSGAQNMTDLSEYNRNYDKLFVFQHFSMNRFVIDLRDFMTKNPLNLDIQNMTLYDIICCLGKCHKKEIFI